MNKLGLLIVLLLAALMLQAQTEDWHWAKQAGGPNHDYGISIATDANGNSYVTGYFSDISSFGRTTLNSSGLFDVYVAKLDPSGNWLWATNAGGVDNDYGDAIALDDSGNIYVTGYFNGTASFGSITITSSGGLDVFFAKLDPNGNWLWAMKAGGAIDDYGSGIAIDITGNCYITGTFQGTALFGDTTLTSGGSRDVFVGKLDSNGNWLWIKKGGGSSGGKTCNAIATDIYGNCVVTGYFMGNVGFGSTTLNNSTNYSDTFAAKLDSNGNWMWATRASASLQIQAYGISTDSACNSYVIGWFKSTATFGSITVGHITNNTDMFVAKLSPNGTWLWAKKAGGSNNDDGYGIKTDAAGNSYLTGSFEGTAYFGSSSISINPSGEKDVYVAKIDNNGNWLWAIQAGGTSYDYCFGIDIDEQDNCFVTGSFMGAPQFGNSILASSGGYDTFIAKVGRPFCSVVAPSGGEQWQAGSTQTVYWSAVNASSHVNIFLSIDIGQTWISLNANPLDSILGRFSFTVPFVNSSQCLIKVMSSSNSFWFDVSDAPFMISSGSPTSSLFLTAPTNSILMTGTSCAVSWLAIGVSTVDIAYSIDWGLNWQSIAMDLPVTQGSYNWIVPDISISACYLRVSDSANPSVYDWSDDPFSICKLVLLSPNGGEFYQTGWSRDITWQSDLVSNVKLEYSIDGGSSWQTIIDDISAFTGSYAWTLPDIASDQYVIKVSDASDSSINDYSDAAFTVCSLQVTYPTSYGIKLQEGRDCNITWNTQLLPGSVKLELTTNGTSYATIASGLEAALQGYFWTVPDTPSTSCRIRIVSEYDNQVVSSSAYNFTISRLVVTAPNGAENWSAQTTKVISWTSANVSSLMLEYSSDDGATWQTIHASVAASGGSYNWTLPNIHSTQCRVRITDTSNSAIWDISDNTFTIRPQIILSAPNGNEFLTVGSVFSLFWSCTAEVSFALIDYSIDGGTSWMPIQASNYPASVGRYDWIVPNNPSTNCLVRVRKHDNSAIFDVSDGAFTITATPVPPVAQFSADTTSGLEPLSVQFTDNSTPGTGNITSWLWEFGNGNSSILQNPLYVYNTPGVYSVTLTVTNAAGLSNSLTLEDYITVLPRFPVIATNPENRLDFGNVYLGSSSAPQSLWIRNAGTATMHVDALSFLLASSPFVVQERVLPFSIPEGDSLCVHLVFTPQVAGNVADSLYIHSNAANDPTWVLGLRGSGEYVPPKPPTGLETAMMGCDMHISWDAVTETIFDTPITPDGYLVFYNGTSDPASEYYFFLGFTPGLSYTHNYVGRYAEFMFYRVRAVKHYGPRGGDLDLLVPGMTEAEVLRVLRGE